MKGSGSGYKYSEAEARGTEGGSGRSRVVNLLAVVIVILLGVAGTLVYLYMRQSSTSEQVQNILIMEKDSLSLNLERVISEYETIQTDNAELQVRLDEERARAEKLLVEVRQVKEVSYAKIKEYQRELGTLRAIMRKMVGEIDSLNTLNQALVAENTKVRTEYQESQRNVQQLSEEKEQLTVRVTKGAVVSARNVVLVGLNSRDKEVTRAGRSKKLRVCFTLMENAIADPGIRTAYIRIFGPDGVLLANAEGGTFERQGEPTTYSAMREVDYQNLDTEVCIYYGDNSSFEKGVYQVEVYFGGEQVGQGEALFR